MRKFFGFLLGLVSIIWGASALFHLFLAADNYVDIRGTSSSLQIGYGLLGLALSAGAWVLGSNLRKPSTPIN